MTASWVECLGRGPIEGSFGVLNLDDEASAMGFSDQGNQRFGKLLIPQSKSCTLSSSILPLYGKWIDPTWHRP